MVSMQRQRIHHGLPVERVSPLKDLSCNRPERVGLLPQDLEQLKVGDERERLFCKSAYRPSLTNTRSVRQTSIPAHMYTEQSGYLRFAAGLLESMIAHDFILSVLQTVVWQ